MKNFYARILKVRLGFVLPSIIIVLILVVLGQDFLVFPQLIFDLRASSTRAPIELPSGVESMFLQTPDGKKVELWRLSAASGVPARGTALLFHGNGGHLSTFFPFMSWLSSVGLTAYQMEYRGYGTSTGWPSVKSIEADAALAVKAISENEKITLDEIVPMGVSLGSGFAVSVAKQYGMRNLVLVTPFTSLKDAARSRPWIGWLNFLMWNEVRSLEMLRQLQDVCVVDAHGTSDSIIPYQHSLKLKEAYSGRAGFTLITAENKDHNDAFWAVEDEVAKALINCVERPK